MNGKSSIVNEKLNRIHHTPLTIDDAKWDV